MSTTREVKVRLSAETKGFERAGKDAAGVVAALKAAGPAQKDFRGLSSQVSTVGKGLKDLAREARDFANQVARAGAEATRAARTWSSGRDDRGRMPAPKEQDDREDRRPPPRRRSASFARGLIQGSGLGEYYPDDNVRGMLTQAAGRSLGTIGRGLASAPFTGARGMSTALGGIPMVGGFLSGQMDSLLGSAQEAIQQRQAVASTLSPLTSQSALLAAQGAGPEGTRAAMEEMRTTTARGFLAAGRDGGVNTLDQAVDLVSQILQTRGGTTDDLTERDFQTAASARNLGIGADVSGALLRGGAQGAFTGTGSSVGIDGSVTPMGDFETMGLREMIQSLTDTAEVLGLGGADRDRYMREIASAVMSFDQTGIKANIPGLGQAAAFLQSDGASPTRALALAQSLQSRVQSVGMTGPQSAEDMALLQDFGEYKGGGLDEYVDSAERMQSGVITEEGLQKLINRAKSSGLSEKGQSLVLSNLFQRAGLNVGSKEARENYLNAGPDGSAYQALREKMAAPKPDVFAAGNASTDSAVNRAQQQQQTRADVGQSMITAAQEFENIQLNMMKAFASFSGEITAVSKLLNTASRGAGDMITRIHGVLQRFEHAVGLMPGGKD